MIYAVRINGAIQYWQVRREKFYGLQRYYLFEFIFVNEFLIIKIKIKHGKRSVNKKA